MSWGLIFYFFLLYHELFCVLMETFYNQGKGRETYYPNFLQLITLINYTEGQSWSSDVFLMWLEFLLPLKQFSVA